MAGCWINGRLFALAVVLAACRTNTDLRIPHLQGLTQTESLPNCTYTLWNNSRLRKEYIVEPYKGNLQMKCHAWRQRAVVTGETLAFVANIAKTWNLTLSFAYRCHYIGSLEYRDLKSNHTGDNIIFMDVKGCSVYLTSTNLHPLKLIPNAIYERIENSVFYVTSEILLQVMMDIHTLDCPFGQNMKYIHSRNVSMLVDGMSFHAWSHLSPKILHEPNNTEVLRQVLHEQSTMTMSHCPALEIIEVINSPVSTDTLDNLKAPNLNMLNFSAASLEKVPEFIENIFKIHGFQYKSLKHIDLSWNKITHFDFKSEKLITAQRTFVALNRSGYTIQIDLRHCQISNLTLRNVECMKEYPILRVDISGNPLNCDCHLKPVLEYVLANQEYFRHSYYKYLLDMTCAKPSALHGVKLKDVQTDKLCAHESISVRTLILFLLGACVTITMLATFMFKCRHTVAAIIHRYICIVVCPTSFKGHHVFLACSTENSKTAYDMLEILEKYRPKINIYYAERDVGLGTSWTREISKAMTESTYVILLLSNNFIKSEFCMWEFSLAHTLYVQRRQQCILPIILGTREDLEISESQNPDLHLFLRINNYLELGERWFWEKLAHKLHSSPKQHNYEDSHFNGDGEQSQTSVRNMHLGLSPLSSRIVN